MGSTEARMQCRRGVCFGVQFGASLTFARSRHAPRGAVTQAKYNASRPVIRTLELPGPPPSNLFAQRRISPVQKRAPPGRIRAARHGQTKHARMTTRATAAPRVVKRSRGTPPSKSSRGVWWFRRCVSALFVHVNMLLAAYAGAALATAARLHWDPLTYLVPREALPAEYALLSRALLAGGCALLLLAGGAAVALYAARWRRRILLLAYSVSMLALGAAGAAALRWAEAELRPHIERGRAHMHVLIQSTRHVLSLIAVFHDFTPTLQPFLETLEKESTAKLKLAMMGVATLAALQISGALLALLLAALPPPRGASDDDD